MATLYPDSLDPVDINGGSTSALFRLSTPSLLGEALAATIDTIGGATWAPWLLFGDPVFHVTDPLAAVTVSGTIAVSVYGYESNMSANAKLSIKLHVLDAYVPSGFVDYTTYRYIGQYSDDVEMATSGGLLTFSFTPTAFSIPAGGRLVVQIGLANAGTMGSGYSASISTGFPNTTITLSEALSVYTPPVVVTGAAALGGIGSVSAAATNVPNPTSTASLAGSGTLTVKGYTPLRYSQGLGLACAGTLSGVGSNTIRTVLFDSMTFPAQSYGVYDHGAAFFGAFSSPGAGYLFGGSIIGSSTDRVTKYSYVSLTASALGSSLSFARSSPCGVASADAGYALGGAIDSATYYSTIERMLFSSESVAVSSGSLPEPSSYVCSGASPTHGYLLGGTIPSGLGDVAARLSFATDTTASQSYALGNDYTLGSALGTQDETVLVNPGLLSKTAVKLHHGTETIVQLSAGFDRPRWSALACSGVSVGVVLGGISYVPGTTTIEYYRLAESFSFPTNTASMIGAGLFVVGENGAGLSKRTFSDSSSAIPIGRGTLSAKSWLYEKSGHGYLCGGNTFTSPYESNRLWRIDYATETSALREATLPTNCAGANSIGSLGGERWGYVFRSTSTYISTAYYDEISAVNLFTETSRYVASPANFQTASFSFLHANDRGYRHGAWGGFTPSYRVTWNYATETSGTATVSGDDFGSYAAISSATAGYYNTSASTTQLSSKLLFATETVTALGGTGGSKRYNNSTVASAIRGISAGGAISGTSQTAMEEVAFATDTVAVLGTALVVATTGAGSVSASTKGYLHGGMAGGAAAILQSINLSNGVVTQLGTSSAHNQYAAGLWSRGAIYGFTDQITGSGGLGATGVIADIGPVYGSVALAGSSALAASASTTSLSSVLGSATLTAASDLAPTATIWITQFAQASLSGSATVSVSGNVDPGGAAACAGSGLLSATGRRDRNIRPRLWSSGSLVTKAIVTGLFLARSRLSGFGNMAGRAGVSSVGIGSLSGACALSVSAQLHKTAQTSLSGAGSLSALADSCFNGSVSLSAAGLLSPAGSSIEFHCGAAMAGSSQLSQQATLIIGAKASLHGNNAFRTRATWPSLDGYAISVNSEIEQRTVTATTRQIVVVT